MSFMELPSVGLPYGINDACLTGIRNPRRSRPAFNGLFAKHKKNADHRQEQPRSAVSSAFRTLGLLMVNRPICHAPRGTIAFTICAHSLSCLIGFTARC